MHEDAQIVDRLIFSHSSLTTQDQRFHYVANGSDKLVVMFDPDVALVVKNNKWVRETGDGIPAKIDIAFVMSSGSECEVAIWAPLQLTTKNADWTIPDCVTSFKVTPVVNGQEETDRRFSVDVQRTAEALNLCQGYPSQCPA